MEPKFIHLRLHTEFSLSDGLLSIPSLISQAQAYHMPAIGITDLSNLYATVKFYQESIQAGIKPIIGVDLFIENNNQNEKYPRLTLFCQNNLGYQNCLKLISKAYLLGQSNGRPIIKKEWLQAHSQGLIALSGAEEGDIGLALIDRNWEEAKASLLYWQSLFPKRFYLEVTRVGKAKEREYIKNILSLADQFQVPIVATNDVRFLESTDFEAHEARVCIQEGLTLNDPSRPRIYTDQQYLRSQKEMQDLFSDMPEALENSVEIAKRCNVTLQLNQVKLPHFKVPEEFSSETYLSSLAQLGLEQRLQTLFCDKPEILAIQRPVYQKRLERELDVINKMGFAGYFLIVADFTKWAKENDIPVGPGRGSGPGSLVAYSLKITDLDPIALELLFERFLNPERVSMPDFDIDFCVEGRDRVIEYVMNKHGHESVSQIITYGTMAAKAVVRDVGRVLGLSYGFVDKIAKLVPFELGMTLEKALEQEPLLRERYEVEEDVKTLIDLARKLEGLTRNVGKHAGGIVIAPGLLTDFVPLYCEPNEPSHPVTQFDKDDVETVGLVKFDFLGLKTLTIIDRALRIINSDKESPIDISLIPLNDELTFRLLKNCQSTAVFQLESHGMRDLIKRLQPDCFEDLIALVALFRPGPLQSGMVDDFINRKHGRAKVIYPHPQLEPILRPTYGVILYQEQVMQIAQVLAGFTLGAADILRRAMGKKKPEEMAKQREIFCKGASSRGVNSDIAEHIFDLMEKFAGYGFNKSHSASYALIAYQTAWLKAHYPAAFMSAVLSADMDKTEKVIVFLNECQTLKLHVSPPDINKSNYHFTMLSDQHLMYGLGAIKGMGEAAIDNILQARKEGGPFKDLFDLCSRIDLRKVNRRVLEALIKSGACDSLLSNRATLMCSLDHALRHAEQVTHNNMVGQQDLLGMTMDSHTLQYEAQPAWPEDIQLQGEKETLGFYLTGHPTNRYIKELTQFTTCRIANLNQRDHQNARIAGIVTNVRIRQTKRGDRMATFNLDDGTALADLVCFSDSLLKFRNLLNEDQLVVVEGDVSLDEFNNNTRIITREIYGIEQARERFVKYLQIRFNDTPIDVELIKSIFTPYRGGQCPVVLKYVADGSEALIRFGSTWLIQPVDALLGLLKEKFPEIICEFIY